MVWVMLGPLGVAIASDLGLVLRNRDFRLLFVGQGVSRLGDGLYTAAVAWLAWSFSHSPGSVAFVAVALAGAAAFFAGALVATAFAGAALPAVAGAMPLSIPNLTLERASNLDDPGPPRLNR